MGGCIGSNFKTTERKADAVLSLPDIRAARPTLTYEARPNARIYLHSTRTYQLFFFSVKGGLNQVYRVLWSATNHTKEKMYQLDRNGFYSFIAMTKSFPLGAYKIYSGYDLKEISYNGTNFCLSTGTKLFGIVLVRILCPPNLIIPFLHYTCDKTGRTFIPCCKACVDNKVRETCSHTER